MSGWRARELVREAWRSVISGWRRTTLVALIAGGLAAGITWAELRASAELVDYQESFAARGGWVAVASAEGGRIPAARCERYAARPWVVAAGGARAGATVSLATGPGTLFQTTEATRGALEAWAGGPLDAGPGVVVGSAAAAESGLRPGMVAAVKGGEPRPVAATLDAELRNPQVARSVIGVVAPNGFVDQCWVETVPGGLDAGLEVLAAELAGAGPGLEVRPLVRLDEFARDPVAELAGRGEARAWLPAGLVTAVLVWLTVWARTSEIGLYRAVGTSSAQLWLLGQLETALVLGTAMAGGYLWAAAAFGALHPDPASADQLAIAARTALSALLVALVAGPLAWLAAGRAEIAAQLKDR